MNSFSANNEAFSGAFQGTHWRSAALLCLLLPSLAWSEAADGLNVFTDGEVIYAEQINENFRYVLENGGCSVAQTEAGAFISCGDGSSAFIGSLPDEAQYPSASLPAADLSSIATGDIVVVDSDGVILGELAFESPLSILLPLSPTGPKAALYLREFSGSVSAGAMSSTHTVYFSESDCVGQAFLTEYPLIAWSGQSLVATPRDRQVGTNVRSRYRTNTGGCNNVNYLLPGLYPATTLTLPAEIQNAKPPLSIIQAESSLAN